MHVKRKAPDAGLRIAAEWLGRPASVREALGSSLPAPHKPAVVANPYSLNTLEVDAGRSEFKASPGTKPGQYRKPFLFKELNAFLVPLTQFILAFYALDLSCLKAHQAVLSLKVP